MIHFVESHIKISPENDCYLFRNSILNYVNPVLLIIVYDFSLI